MNNTQRYNKKLLKDYDLILKAFPYHNVLRKELAKHIQQKKLKVIEIGPGHGESTQYILDEIGHVDLTLVDLNCDTAQYLKTHKNQNIHLIHADATKYLKTLPENSFDVFTASWTIHNFNKETRKGLLKDAQRILRNGGMFIVMDKILPNDKEEREKMMKHHKTMYDFFTKKGAGELRKAMIEHEDQDLSEDYIMIEDEFKKDLEEAGFTDVQIISRKQRDVVLVATTN